MSAIHQCTCDSCGNTFNKSDAGSNDRLCANCSHLTETISPGIVNTEDDDLEATIDLSNVVESPGDGIDVTIDLANVVDTVGDGVDATIDSVGVSDSATDLASRSTPSRKFKGKRFGRFEVCAKLGFGSFGTVVLAYDPMLDREIALKIPRFPPDQPELVERFQREARAAARLRHPNIVTTFECGKVGDNYYIATEFVDGMPLSDKIHKGSGYDERQAATWVSELADALAYAHSELIVHRDIKPSNIMLSNTGRPELMDFGLAKVESEDDGMTIDGSVMGTPAYMAPEQARGDIKATGPHSDQYSLGCVLYELLTKNKPFTGPVHTVISQVAGDVEPEPIRRVLPGVPADLEAICEKALSKLPEDRYATATEMASDLERWLRGEPIHARRINVAERLWRWCRRNRTVASLLLMVASLLLLGTIGSLIAAVNFRDLAEKEGESAARARDKEAEAALRLADMFTFTGLAAAQEGDPAQAVLWFAHAAEQSQADPQRERANRVRFQTWAKATPIAVRAMEHPDEYVKYMEFDPSGRFLLVLAHDFDSYLWDLSTGQLIDAPDRNPKANAAAWSPDGTWLAQGFGSGFELNEIGSWNQVARESLPGLVACLAFSPDGKWLAVATSDQSENTVRLWDCVNRVLAAPVIKHPARIRKLVFGAHSGKLATSCADGSTRIFSIPLNEDVPESLVGSIANFGPIYADMPDAPVFVDDDEALITLPTEHRGSPEAFSSSTGQPLTTFALTQIDNSYFNTFAASPDRKYLVAGTSKGAAFWDIAAKSRIGELMPHTNLIPSIAMHRDGKILLTGSIDRTARLWEIPSGEPISPRIEHQDEIRFVAFSPNENLFATCQKDGLVKIWRFSPRDPDDRQHPLGWNDAFLRQSADGRFVIPSGWNNNRTSRTLRVFDSSLGQPACQPINTAGLLNAQAISPTGDIVMGLSSRLTDLGEANVTGRSEQMRNEGGWIELWNRESGNPKTEAIETPSEPIAGAFHPTRTMAAVLCAGGQLLWINTDSGQIERRSMHEGELRTGFLIRGYLRFAPDGDTLATWGLGKRVVAWDVDTGKPRYALETNSWCSDLTHSRDGKLMVISGPDQVRIVNTENGEDEVPPLVQPDWVFTARFNADETLLLTAGRDRIARVWDWRRGRLAAPELEHDDEVLDVQFLNGGDWVLTACRDGSVRFWDRHSGRPLAPPKTITKLNYSLLLSPNGRRAFVSGLDDHLHVLSLERFFDTASLDTAARRRLAELVSGRRQLESGGVANLNSTEWQDRWRAVQSDGSLPSIVDLNIAEQP